MTVALSVLCYSNVMTVALCPDTPVLQLCHDSCSLCPVLCYSVSRQSHSLSCPVLQHVMTVALSVLCSSNVMTVALCPDTPVLQLCHDSCSLCPVLCYSVSRQSHSLSCPVLQHVMTVALSVLCSSNVMTVALCPDTPVLQLCHDSCSLCPVLCYSYVMTSDSCTLCPDVLQQ